MPARSTSDVVALVRGERHEVVGFRIERDPDKDTSTIRSLFSLGADLGSPIAAAAAALVPTPLVAPPPPAILTSLPPPTVRLAIALDAPTGTELVSYDLGPDVDAVTAPMRIDLGAVRVLPGAPIAVEHSAIVAAMRADRSRGARLARWSLADGALFWRDVLDAEEVTRVDAHRDAASGALFAFTVGDRVMSDAGRPLGASSTHAPVFVRGTPRLLDAAAWPTFGL